MHADDASVVHLEHFTNAVTTQVRNIRSIPMRYRSLGRSGLTMSEIALGCEGLLGKPEAFVRSALDMMESHGANGIDLYSPNPELRTALGRALSGRREKFVLEAHICTIWKDGQYKRTRRMDEVRA